MHASRFLSPYCYRVMYFWSVWLRWGGFACRGGALAVACEGALAGTLTLRLSQVATYQFGAAGFLAPLRITRLFSRR